VSARRADRAAVSTRPLGELRIIGGQWRSRRVAFEAGDGVRPTPDRVRQTVFDWLAPRIEGARCLDLFAGSGAMGLEALSRGAAFVRFVDDGRAQVARIGEALQRLGGTQRAELHAGDALSELARVPARPYDVVFLDPPYGSDLLARALSKVSAVLAADARVYAEWPEERRPALPPGCEWIREKSAGRVSFGLFTHVQPGSRA
jgi:16S rRNA (guanine966-N2)-methyltransferase